MYQVINGDCNQVLTDRMQTRPVSCKATLIFADPPYNIGIDYGSTYDDLRHRKIYLSWCRDWIGHCIMNLTDNGSLWILINHEHAADIEVMARDACGLTMINWITWFESFGVNTTSKFNRCSRRLLHLVMNPQEYLFHKSAVMRPSDRQVKYNDKRAMAGGKIWDDVWGINPPIPRVCGTYRERIPEFPTQLPIKLLDPIVGCASNPGDLVIDPFSGSGTTGEACLKLGRNYLGIEISPSYAGLSRERLERVERMISSELIKD